MAQQQDANTAAKILLFMDNCPSYMLITLCNVAIKFLLKNTTSRLQPLDQGITTLLKRAHTNYMIDNITIAMKALKNITNLAKKVTIFDAVLNTKLAWDAVPKSAIVKYFRQFGIHEHMVQQQEPPTQHPASQKDPMILMLTSKTCSKGTQG